jgi:heme A synthase
MSLGEIHGRLGFTALYFITILAIWALWRFFRKEGVNSNYWGALAIAEILVLLQGALGAYLWLSGLRPGRGVHILYGIVAALIIPGIYLFTKGDEDRRVMLIYGVGLLIMVGIILRGVMTAAPVGISLLLP